jgi:dolichol-phosphate mannosyltransferase
MRVAAVLPCYNSKDHVLGVLERIGPEIEQIFVVDDKCPMGTGAFVTERCFDPRVTVLMHDINQGVGGATVTGYQAALSVGCDIVVKIDSDGQMDPALIPGLIKPIEQGFADYAKGNRFFNPDDSRQMPIGRLLGNLGLSFLTKLSAGYWDIFDPTNGFTAIHRSALSRLPLLKLSSRYFFESDMLFRLNIASAVVVDMPMTAKYGDEVSGLNAVRSIPEFAIKHFRVFAKRVGYKYFLRDFSMGSINLVLGICLMGFGGAFGFAVWVGSAITGVPATAGTVMIAALPLIVGVQMLMGFWAQDYNSVPKIPLQTRAPETK